jgi:hypothetical protein
MFRGRPSPVTRERLAITLFAVFAIAGGTCLALSWLRAPEWAFYVVIAAFPVTWLLAASVAIWRADN